MVLDPVDNMDEENGWETTLLICFGQTTDRVRYFEVAEVIWLTQVSKVCIL